MISTKGLKSVLVSILSDWSEQHIDMLLQPLSKNEDGDVNCEGFVDWIMGGVEFAESDLVEKQVQPLDLEYPEIEANPYLNVLVAAGAEEATTRNSSMSREIQGAVERARRQFEGIPSRRQDAIHQCLTFDDITSRASRLKPSFDRLINHMAEVAREALPAISISVRVGDVKSSARGMKKCIVDYGGDSSQMADMLRATIVVDGTVDDLYKVACAITTASAFRKRSVHFVQFRDRYQKPVGYYRDMLSHVRMDGFLCELQFNLKSMIDVKESAAGHGHYEYTRLANDDLLIACVQNDLRAATHAARRGANAKGLVESIHGLSSLHFAAYHGNSALIGLVLRQGADPYHADKYGYIPLHRAVLNRDEKTVNQLLTVMQKDTLLNSFTAASGVRFMECVEVVVDLNIFDRAVVDFAAVVVEGALDHSDHEVRSAAINTIGILGQLSNFLVKKCADVAAEIEGDRIVKQLASKSLPAPMLLRSLRTALTKSIDEVIADSSGSRTDRLAKLLDHCTRLRKHVGRLLSWTPGLQVDSASQACLQCLLHEHCGTVKLLLQAHMHDAASVVTVWDAELRFYALPDGSSCARCCGAEMLLGDDGGTWDLVCTDITREIRRNAFLAMSNKRVCVISGPVGSGKTETANEVCSLLGFDALVIDPSAEVDRMITCAKVCQMGQAKKRPVIIEEAFRLQRGVLPVIVQNARTMDIPLFLIAFDASLLVDDVPGEITYIRSQSPGRRQLFEGSLGVFKNCEAASSGLGRFLESMESQCSKQPHYDFGMRCAHKVIRRALSALKDIATIHREPGEEQEIICLAQAAFDVSFPRATGADRQIVCESLLECFGVAVDDLKIWPFTGVRWKDFVFQLLTVVSHSHCIFVVPIAQAEEEQCIEGLRHCALQAGAELELLSESLAQVTIAELLGVFSNDGGWVDGALSACLRRMMRAAGRPFWAVVRIGSAQSLDMFEHIHTLMDRNGSVMLPNGEWLALNAEAGNRIIFIGPDGCCHGLSPATVSRCGFLYSDTEALGFQYQDTSTKVHKAGRS